MYDIKAFKWPKPKDTKIAPLWDGNGFQVDGILTPFLTYGERSSGWDSSLTELHEESSSDNHPIDLASRRLALESLTSYLKNSQALVLEAGSSSGYFLDYVTRLAPQLKIIGSDFSNSLVANLAERVKNTPVVQMDLRNCPFDNDTFDGVVALNVLEHIDNDVAAMGEIYRILKPGGIAHIEVPAGPGCFDYYDEFLMHFRRYSSSELVAQVKQIGFEVLRSTHLGASVFPVFYLTKKRNRRMKLSQAEKAQLVSKQITTSKKSHLFELAIKTEMALGRFVRYPVGIRCVLTLRKP